MSQDLTTTLRPGATIAGKYAITRTLGQGGMGIVLEAEHVRLGQRVAIKTLLPSARGSEGLCARFEREARAAATLRGRHVARVTDVDTLPDGTPYMVMELLRGHDLAAELAERGPLPVSEACGYVLDACEAMEEAHAAGIVHRDLKPSNLFLAEDGETRCLKVLDFGVSKVETDKSELTATVGAIGTPMYMSPEQLRSSKTVDARTDVWALTSILYELLTGRAPFVADSVASLGAAIVTEEPAPLAELRAGLPRALQSIVSRGLQKDPALRIASVRELAVALRAVVSPSAHAATVESDGTGTIPLPDARMSAPPRARRPLVLGAAVLAAAIVATALWLWRAGPRPDPAPGASAPSPIPSPAATLTASASPDASASGRAVEAAASADPARTGPTASARPPRAGLVPTAPPAARSKEPERAPADPPRPRPPDVPAQL